VNVYLQEILTGGSPSIIVPDGGLVGAGFYVTRTGTVPSGATTINSNGINPNTNATNPGTPNDGFGSGGALSSQVANDGSAARLLEGAAGTTQGPTGQSTPTGRLILLGTVTLTAGAAGTVTTFSLQPYKNAPTSLGGSGQNGNTLTFNFTDVDVTNNTEQGGPPPVYTGANDSVFQTFTVTVAPEPSSMLLCSLAICGGAYVAYRRRRGQASKLQLA